MDKKNRLSTDYDDEDMAWLDDDDDYLDDGGILSSLLFGEKKKKKKTAKDNPKKDNEQPGRVQRARGEDEGRANRHGSKAVSDGHDSKTAPDRHGSKAVSDGHDSKAAPDRHGSKAAPDRHGSKAVPDRESKASMTRKPRPARPTTDESEKSVYREENAAVRTERADRTARRRKISADRTPVKLEEENTRPVRTPAASAGTVGEYDEYYHENSRSRRMRNNQNYSDKRKDSDKREDLDKKKGPRDYAGRVGSATEHASTSVDNLLREVSNLEADSRQRHENLRREAWERTQRNVAKAKAEVERLELEREQNEKEEARKKRVREELQRRQMEKTQISSDTENVQPDLDTAEPRTNSDSDVDKIHPDHTVESEKTQPEQEVKTEKQSVDTDDAPEDDQVKADEIPVSDQTTAKESPEDIPMKPDVKESAEKNESDKNESGKTDSDKNESGKTDSDKNESGKTDSDKNKPDKNILDMDALERIERDIDEDRLKYSESDTEDLGLGEIGRALGFDAVDLEDDEEEPEEDEESDSEKFFRENLLDEADPKVVNPERKKINISTKVWAIAFFVLLALLILISVIYAKNYARMKYNEMNINEISEDQLLVNNGVKESTSGYRTIALYGVDSRDQNMDVGTNSDSIIIVSINESTHEIKLVSVYRDTLMDIASGAMTESQKVNYAYQLGGAVTAINTLNTNLDLYITDYVAVDFNAMANIIDAVGGVDIQIADNEINSFNKNLAEQISISGKYSSGITQAGQYTLDGQQAVAYSRIRSTDSGDITRTERQRIVLLKVMGKLVKADTGSLSAFVDVSFKSISTSLDKDAILDIVNDVAKYKVVDTVGFPFTYEAVNSEEKGNCLVAADMATNVQALHEYLYGNTHYKVSDASKQISSSLEKETGVSAQKVKIETDNPGDGISDDSENGDLRTITEPPKGMILDE